MKRIQYLNSMVAALESGAGDFAMEILRRAAIGLSEQDFRWLSAKFSIVQTKKIPVLGKIS